MRVYAFQLFMLLFISACTTQHVEINIHKSGEVETTTTSPQPKLQVNNVTDTPKPDLKIVEKKVPVILTNSCPKFIMPNLIPTPPVPKDIITKREMLDEELIGILTEYAYELRKNAIENQATLRASYKQYSDSCKK